MQRNGGKLRLASETSSRCAETGCLYLPFSVDVEDLNAIVLAVTDQDTILAIHDDGMWKSELSMFDATSPP